MTEDLVDAGMEPTVPVWAVFGDLMSGLLGAFVLILVCVLGMQLDLATKLEAEVKQRQAESQRREALEQFAIPVLTGRGTVPEERDRGSALRGLPAPRDGMGPRTCYDTRTGTRVGPLDQGARCRRSQTRC